MLFPGVRIKLTSRHLERARIPQRFWGVRLDQVSEASTADGTVQGQIRAYLKNLGVALRAGTGLHLYGDNGTGKTSIAALVAMEAMRLGGKVLFATAEELCRAAIEGTPFDENETLLERARSVDLLVVDDLGKEHRGDSGFFQRTLEGLIRYRASRRLAVVITTNMVVGRKGEDACGLYSAYGASLVEVVKESVVLLKVNGESLRRKATMAFA